MTPNRRKRIVEIARHILRENNIEGPPVAVRSIAKKLGAKIVSSALDGELSGIIYVRNGSPIIGINSRHHSNRQRFTIAHECGHLLLHKNMISREIHVDKNFRMLRRDALSATGTSVIEIEANLFAAEILMPEHFLNDAFNNEPADIDEEETAKSLAKIFKVSPAAMSFRLGNLFT